jgi:hypothetical protein
LAGIFHRFYALLVGLGITTLAAVVTIRENGGIHLTDQEGIETLRGEKLNYVPVLESKFIKK